MPPPTFLRLGCDTDPPPSLGGGLGGPPSDSLLTGEKIVKSERKQLGRSGREHIAYRIIGDNSSGWAEAAILWGGTVDMIVHFSDNNHFVSSALHLPSSIPAKEALSSPPVGDQGWDGVLLSTVLSERDAQGGGGFVSTVATPDCYICPPPSFASANKEPLAGFSHSL